MECLPGPIEITALPSRDAGGILWIILANCEFEGQPCVPVSSRYVQLRLLRAGDTTRCLDRGLNKHVRSYLQPIWKGRSVQLGCIKGTETPTTISQKKGAFLHSSNQRIHLFLLIINVKQFVVSCIHVVLSLIVDSTISESNTWKEYLPNS